MSLAGKLKIGVEGLVITAGAAFQIPDEIRRLFGISSIGELFQGVFEYNLVGHAGDFAILNSCIENGSEGWCGDGPRDIRDYGDQDDDEKRENLHCRCDFYR